MLSATVDLYPEVMERLGFNAFTGFMLSATAPIRPRAYRKRLQTALFRPFLPFFTSISLLLAPSSAIRASFFFPKQGGCSFFYAFYPLKMAPRGHFGRFLALIFRASSEVPYPPLMLEKRET